MRSCKSSRAAGRLLMIRRLLSPRGCPRPRSHTTFLSFLLLPQAARAQAVYGSIRGTITDATGGRAARRHRHDHQPRSQDVRHGGHRTNRRLPQGAPAARVPTRSRRSSGLQAGGRRPTWSVSVDTQTHVDFSLELGNVTESGRGRRRRARCSRPTAPTSRRRSTRSRSPTCRCSIATSRSSSC